MIHLKTFESYNQEPIFEQLDLFLKSPARNQWIHDDPENPIMSVYVRKGSRRMVEGKVFEFFDLASITIDESHWGQKIFQNFLKRLVSDYPFNIYVESILSPAVEHVCEKFGFIKHHSINRYLIRDRISESVSERKEYKEIPMSEWSRLVDNPDEKYTEREMSTVGKIADERGMTIKFFNRDIFKEKDMDIFDLLVTDIDEGEYKASIIKKEDLYYLALVRIRTETSINDRFFGFVLDQERGLREFMEDFKEIVLEKRKKTT